jgi:ubiquinone/menaquinone biosynthesis C-methylase UbiE
MKKIDYFIEKYLKNRPMFMAIIRSQEAMLFQKHQKYIKNKALDFGCGDGFFAQTVFEEKTIDDGLDLFDNERIEEAKKEKIYKKITLYDGNKIPYPDSHFQTVISNCVLEHLSNLNQSLKEIYRVLKPNGYFFTSVMTDQWENYLFGSKIFGKTYLKYMSKTQVHHNLFSLSQWKTQFKQAGFLSLKIEGYLYKKSAFYLDLFHYLSIGSLISYKLFKKWVLFSIPFLNRIKTQFIKKIAIKENSPNKASALFFVLKK